MPNETDYRHPDDARKDAELFLLTGDNVDPPDDGTEIGPEVSHPLVQGGPSIPMIEAHVQSDGSVRLHWGAIPDATGYKVYRGTSPAPTDQLGSDTTERTIIDTPTKGSRYYYRVKAKNAAGNSDYSNQVSVRVGDS